MAVVQQDLEKLSDVLDVLVEWSGVSDDTPDDTEILSSPSGIITLGDIRDAYSTVHGIGEILRNNKGG